MAWSIFVPVTPCPILDRGGDFRLGAADWGWSFSSRRLATREGYAIERRICPIAAGASALETRRADAVHGHNGSGPDGGHKCAGHCSMQGKGSLEEVFAVIGR